MVIQETIYFVLLREILARIKVTKPINSFHSRRAKIEQGYFYQPVCNANKVPTTKKGALYHSLDSSYMSKGG